MNLATQLLIVFALILVNGLLAMAEMAIVSSRKTRLRHLANSGKRGARSALKLAENPGPFLSSVQIGITLVSIGLGAFSESKFVQALAVKLADVPLVGEHSEGVAIAIVISAITYISLVVGELVPKQLALRNAESIAIVVARPMRGLAKVAYPVVRLLTLSAAGVVKVFRLPQAARPTITEEEVKMIIGQAAEAGVVKEAEQDMMIGVLRLGDMLARDLMTPRHEMITLQEGESGAAVWEKVIATGHSYFPVVGGPRGDIVGVTSIKPLAARLLSGKTADPKATMQPPLYVPENLPGLKALEKLQQSNAHIALVLNEHGSVEGLLTANDLLKAVVGEVGTGDDPHDPSVVEREDGSFLIDGGLSIMEVKELLKIRKLPSEDGSYTTLGGMVMAKLGRIPRTGDSFKWRNYRFEVVDMDRRRVDKVLVKKLPKTVPHSSAAKKLKAEKPEKGEKTAKAERAAKAEEAAKAEKAEMGE